jgi:hypothetical protein
MTPTLRISTRKGLFTITKNAADQSPGQPPEWLIARTDFLGDNVTLSLFDASSTYLYAALEHGHFGVKLHRLAIGKDGEWGSNPTDSHWQEIATPQFPKRPEGSEPSVDAMGQTIPDTVQLIWSLEAGGPNEDDQPGRLWCGTIPGGLFRSDDHGDSWQLIESLWNHPDRAKWMGGGKDYPGIHSICVDPRDPRRVAVAVSCGGVWLTEDDGDSWACRADGMWAAYMPPDRKNDPAIQDPHCMVQCPGQPNTYWAQHHNGVFRSSDGCTSWQDLKDIEPSNFGFAVAVHPQDGKTAWLIPGINDEKRIPVGGKLVVTRTRDGGENFDVLSNGLPQDHAYDIVFRHALDIDSTGSTLAFGTTTGSVFISEDQGDSWQNISQHLPPVYAVSFDK